MAIYMNESTAEDYEIHKRKAYFVQVFNLLWQKNKETNKSEIVIVQEQEEQQYKGKFKKHKNGRITHELLEVRQKYAIF